MSKVVARTVLGLLIAAVVLIGTANIVMADDDGGAADPNAAQVIR